MKLSQVLSFAFVVTMAMQTLDIIGHFTTITWNGEIIKPETAVHLPYIAIKMTVVFLTMAAFTYFMGIGTKRGLLGIFTASAVFDLYYRFAEATLDRTVFVLDEKRLSWIFFHSLCIFVPYWLITRYILDTPTKAGVTYSNPLQAKKRLWVTSAIAFILSGIFAFTTKEFYKTHGFFFALGPIAFHFNEYILIGTVLFITAITHFYKAIELTLNKKA